MIIKLGEKEDIPRDFAKVVVDIERGVLSAVCELHSDCADELVSDGSDWKNLWGANVYLDRKKIDFASLINIRPSVGNRSMIIELSDVRLKVENIIKKPFRYECRSLAYITKAHPALIGGGRVGTRPSVGRGTKRRILRCS